VPTFSIDSLKAKDLGWSCSLIAKDRLDSDILTSKEIKYRDSNKTPWNRLSPSRNKSRSARVRASVLWLSQSCRVNQA